MRWPSRILTCLLVCGCSSAPNGPSTAAGDASVGDGSLSSDGGVLLMEPDDGGVCNVLVDTANVTTKIVDGGAPAPQGGTIVDGVYVLTEITTYGAGDPSYRSGGIHRFAGGAEEFALGNQAINHTFVISGTAVTFTEMCHMPADLYQPGLTHTVQFTATPTQYVEFQTPAGPTGPTRVLTFSRQ